MAKYVPDIKTQRWVIIAPTRIKRPEDSEISKAPCPFCEGKESETPPEVYRIGPGEKDCSGWQVRVVPNKFPITDTHEVVVHSPDHTNDIETLPLEQVNRILIAYRDRFRAHEHDGQVMIFSNHGIHAGASLDHPHAQLVVVPHQINLDTLSREPITNLVEVNKTYQTYCPDFSQWPFEEWIAPKSGGTKFSETSDSELPDLARVLQTALRRILVVFNDPNLKHIHGAATFGYNFYIYHGLNWYIRIIPRFIYRAGFELGTGLSVNIFDPTAAAEKLKSITVPI